MNSEILAGRFPAQTFVFGELSGNATEKEDFLLDLAQLRSEYPLEMVSPFEDVDSIAGGVWRAKEFFADSKDDAALKLQFSPHTNNLPLHSHDFSDRAIVVLSGQGVFKFASHPDFNSKVSSQEVGVGSILLFSRGTIHTFETFDTELQLFSYHSPFIEVDDPRQFTLATA